VETLFLGIIASELGLLLLGFVYRLIIETIIIRENMKHNQVPPGFRAVTNEELKELIKDEDKEKPKTGSYL